jgi:DNA invertase Pin-like site-specific DNA recombinase
MNMSYKIPTKTKLLRLQKFYKTDQAIGDLFGVTRQTVHQWRMKYGIKSLRDKIEARNYLIKKGFKAGMSVEKLSIKYNLSLSQTYRAIKSF